MLHEKDYNRRLDTGLQEPRKLAPLLVLYSGDDLTSYRISTRVNGPRKQGPQCIEPMRAGGQTHNDG